MPASSIKCWPLLTQALGKNDADVLLFNNLADMILGPRAFNLHLQQVFNRAAQIPNYRGFCYRVSAKWAACRLVGANFRFRDLNVAKTVEKQRRYVDRVEAMKDAARRVAGQPSGIPSGAMTQGDLQQISQAGFAADLSQLSEWVEKFTDADKERHEGAVSAGDLVHVPDLAEFLASSSLGADSMVVSIRRMEGGMARSGHAIAIQGGDVPKVFDSQLGEYDYKGTNFGRDVVSFLEQAYKGPNTDYLQYHVIRLKRNNPQAEGMPQSSGGQGPLAGVARLLTRRQR